MSDDETFENADAGAAGCVPKQAGEVKKGSYIMLKGHPCKVAESGRPGRGQLLAERPHNRLRRLSAELQNVGEASGKLRPFRTF